MGGRGSLGLGSLLKRATVMVAIREAIASGELDELVGTVRRAAQALLTAKQVAPLIGVKHEKTVARYVRERGLPCARVRRNLRFDPSDVRRWVAQRKGS